MNAFQRYCAALLLLALPILWSQANQKTGDKTKIKSEIVSTVSATLRLQGKQQREQIGALLSEHTDLQGELLLELHRASDVEQKSAVIFLMGWYHCNSCARELAKHVKLKYENNEPYIAKPLWGTYPAVEALARIGQPARYYVFRNIESGADAEFRRLSTDVILLGEGRDVARVLLEKELKKAKHEVARQRFQEALEYVEQRKE